MDTTVTLLGHELCTVLAALRYWQRNGAWKSGRDRITVDEYDIASDGGTLTPLDAEEIDDLCERLNCE